MIKQTLTLVSLLLSILLSQSVLGASFDENKLIIKSESSKKENVEILIEKKALEFRDSYRLQRVLFWGGDEMYIPREIISSILIKQQNNEIYLPFSAFSDLGDPHEVTFKKVRNSVFIFIQGGDAAGSYKATIIIKNKRLFKRKVVSSEFPNQVWAEFNYSFISENSDM